MGSTRPRLSRALTPTTPVLAHPNPPTDNRAGSHRTVLVHEVSPNDSLAGVALKYGTSITELRRANQLWASDSIHLRQVLYVPLDKARHASLETVASLLAQRADGEEEEHTASPHSHPHSRSDPDADPRGPDRPSVVRRIPLRSLSFFPPPSSNSSALAGGLPPRPASSSPSHVLPPAATATASTLSKGSTLTSTLRATALSSLFSVLPINASTRDEIFSRLSIDSVSNSTTVSDDPEHELTAVPTTPKRKPLRIDDDAAPVWTPTTTTLTNSRRKSRARHAWLSESRNGGEEGQGPYTRDVEQIALASSPIHTTQMQPAAVMQLPGSMLRSSAARTTRPLSQDDHHPQMR
ncbi:hypothetical protein BJY52DRAFT_645050 [Lactarius psammicola]|nr:hypothetical protein BJY52DRAFT_645050 [Lactarius psammicola]